MRILTAAILSTCLVTAASAETINMKVSDPLPATDVNSALSIVPWMERLTALTNGEMTFSYFPNGQLGKMQDALANVQSGIADISHINPGNNSDKLPLSSVADIPGIYADACTGARALMPLLKEGGLLYEVEWKKEGVRPLFPVVQPKYTLYMRDKQINELSDLGGMRLRAAGSAQTPFVAGLGAVPVLLPFPEVYEAVSRGTIDGLVFPVTGLYLADVVRFIKYAYTEEAFGGAAAVFGMNQKIWERLSPEAQKAVDEVSEQVMLMVCEGLENGATERTAQLEKDGVQIAKMSEAASAALRQEREELYADWAETLDARGLKGSEILAEFRKNVADVVATSN